jgi:hypothetical protein
LPRWRRASPRRTARSTAEVLARAPDEGATRRMTRQYGPLMKPR